jgi:four helix bundle protein
MVLYGRIEKIRTMNTPLLFDFQKLEVYKKAQQFHLESKTLYQNIQLERYVVDQLGRASYSVVLNIAEGSGRNSPNDRKNFFTISRASIFECVAILDSMKLENKIDETKYNEHLKLAAALSKMLFVMIKNLKESR